eukprot:PhF_6_TR6283/c0_g1_i1/m.9514
MFPTSPTLSLPPHPLPIMSPQQVFIGVVTGQGGTLWLRDASSSTLCHSKKRSPAGMVTVLKNPQEHTVTTALPLYASQLCLHYLSKGSCERPGCAFTHRHENEIVTDVSNLLTTQTSTSTLNTSEDSSMILSDVSQTDVSHVDTLDLNASTTTVSMVSKPPSPTLGLLSPSSFSSAMIVPPAALHALSPTASPFSITSSTKGTTSPCSVQVVSPTSAPPPPPTEVTFILGQELAKLYGAQFAALGFRCAESFSALAEYTWALERCLQEIPLQQQHLADLLRRVASVSLNPIVLTATQSMSDFLGTELLVHKSKLEGLGYVTPLSLHIVGTVEKAMETAVHIGIPTRCVGHIVLLVRRALAARSAHKLLFSIG